MTVRYVETELDDDAATDRQSLSSVLQSIVILVGSLGLIAAGLFLLMQMGG